MLDDYPLKDQRWESVSPDHPFLGGADVPDRPEKHVCCEHARCCAAGLTVTSDLTLAFCLLQLRPV